MKAHIRERLIEALESGKYKQGIALVKYIDDKGKLRHCVLGVLGELYVKATSGNRGKFIEREPEECGNVADVAHAQRLRARKVYTMLGMGSALPERVFEWADMSDQEVSDLVEWNEGYNPLNFQEIANKLRLQGIALNVRRKENTYGKAGS